MAGLASRGLGVIWRPLTAELRSLHFIVLARKKLLKDYDAYHRDKSALQTKPEVCKY